MYSPKQILSSKVIKNFLLVYIDGKINLNYLLQNKNLDCSHCGYEFFSAKNEYNSLRVVNMDSYRLVHKESD